MAPDPLTIPMPETRGALEREHVGTEFPHFFWVYGNLNHICL